MSWISVIGKHCDKISEINDDYAKALRFNFNECFKLRKYFPYEPITKTWDSGHFGLIWNIFSGYDKVSVISVKPFKNDIIFTFRTLDLIEPYNGNVNINDITEDHFPKRMIEIVHESNNK